MRLWDVATGHQARDLPAGHRVTSVAFGPDGTTLASGGADGTVRLWDVPYAVGALPYLCALPAQSLTPAEWARILPAGFAYQRICS